MEPTSANYHLRTHANVLLGVHRSVRACVHLEREGEREAETQTERRRDLHRPIDRLIKDITQPHVRHMRKYKLAKMPETDA